MKKQKLRKYKLSLSAYRKENIELKPRTLFIVKIWEEYNKAMKERLWVIKADYIIANEDIPIIFFNEKQLKEGKQE